MCEAALDVLLSMPELLGGSVRVVDVAQEDGLMERYGSRLPVLTIGGRDGLRELDWPFEARDVLAALSA